MSFERGFCGLVDPRTHDQCTLAKTILFQRTYTTNERQPHSEANVDAYPGRSCLERLPIVAYTRPALRQFVGSIN
jgi:hypothetical protein